MLNFQIRVNFVDFITIRPKQGCTALTPLFRRSFTREIWNNNVRLAGSGHASEISNAVSRLVYADTSQYHITSRLIGCGVRVQASDRWFDG
jgi:hypothetical protein